MFVSLVVLYIADKSFTWTQYAQQIYLIHRMVFFCYSATLLSVDCIKLFVGSPRPYYLAVRGDESEENAARLSFPSGHAAFGMSQCLLLSMMLFSSWQYTQKMHADKSYVVG